METVNFITTEFGDDLIVSFAIPRGYPGECISLTLLRTPKYECFLEPHERGVNVSRNDLLEPQNITLEPQCNILEAIRWEGTTVRIATRKGRDYELDVRRVGDDEVREAKKVLGAMNADHAFKMEIIEPEDGRGR